MPPDSSQPPEHIAAHARLEQRVRRENAARLQAEAIAERSLRDLFQRQQEIELLETIAVAANEAANIQSALAMAIEAICRYMQWPVGHALLAHGTDIASSPGRPLRSGRIWHLAEAERYAAFHDVSESLLFHPRQGLPGRILAQAKPVWVQDVTAEADFPRTTQARSAGLRSGFGFPVLVGTEVVAVLEFYSHEIREPDERLLRVMAQIGTQLGRVMERERAQERLLFDAQHDPLTHLANRTQFLQRLRHLMERTRREPELQFAVLFFDLDRFKNVNDSLGHQAGDALVVAVAERLTRFLRITDLLLRDGDESTNVRRADSLVARFGGDEFTILLEGIGDVRDAIRATERIQKKLAEPFTIGEQQVFITASFGIALSHTGYASMDDMLRDADLAMYRAKSQGRACWEVFDQAMRARVVASMQLEADLRRAVQRGEFCLHYQAIVQLPEGTVRGFEALLRWNHPVRGIVSPAEFIPVAEEIGLIRTIGDWVLNEACRKIAYWQQLFPSDPPLDICVNVAPQQLADPQYVAQVAQALRTSVLTPGTLKLELTEGEVMRDPEHARAVFLELKQLGVRLSLDDFGTGYSSLSQLRRLPIDTLKLDRSFVSDMDRDEEKYAIARLIVSLAHILGMDVVAEGAETTGEVDSLIALGSEFVQGYYYHRPADAGEIEALLQARADRIGAML